MVCCHVTSDTNHINNKMLGRITHGLTNLSIHINKQRQFPVVHQYVRLLNQSPALNVAKKVEDSADLLFDLGGTTSVDGPDGRSKVLKLKKETKTGKTPNKKSKPVKVEKKIPKSKKDRSFEQLKFHDLALNLTYVKLPFDHPGLPQLMLVLKSRKQREEKKLLLIEGHRLTIEAVEAGMKLRYLLFSNIKQLENIKSKIQKSFTEQTEIIRVPHNDLSFWSTLTTCPGLITVFEKPADMSKIWEMAQKATPRKLVEKQASGIEIEEVNDIIEETNNIQNITSVPITVICDQVREPNNLGSIIRTCAALPCAKIILLKGCADPWDVKSLRGGCGAQFRIPIIGPIQWEDLSTHLPRPAEMSVFIADNKSKEIDIQIPRDPFEQKRKQNNAQFFQPKPYNDIPFYNCKHIALIIGGETEGVSSHAFDFMKFTSELQIEQENDDGEVTPDNAVIKIPLGNGVESLNASVATAILLFEMRKQFSQ